MLRPGSLSKSNASKSNFRRQVLVAFSLFLEFDTYPSSCLQRGLEGIPEFERGHLFLGQVLELQSSHEEGKRTWGYPKSFDLKTQCFNWDSGIAIRDF